MAFPPGYGISLKSKFVSGASIFAPAVFPSTAFEEPGVELPKRTTAPTRTMAVATIIPMITLVFMASILYHFLKNIHNFFHSFFSPPVFHSVSSTGFQVIRSELHTSELQSQQE